MVKPPKSCSTNFSYKYSFQTLGEKPAPLLSLLWKQAGISLVLPLVYHKNGEKHRVFFFTGKVRGAAGPWVKCMLNLCGQAVRKKLGLFLLTQDAGGFFALIPLSCGGFSGRKKAFFVLFPKKSRGCLHKKRRWWKRGKTESRMGTRVFHSFHRVFHSFGGKGWLRLVSLWKSSLPPGRKKEFSCRIWKKIPKNAWFCQCGGKKPGFCPLGAAFLFEIFEDI